MKVLIVSEGEPDKDYDSMSRLGADVVSGLLESDSYSVICFPLGNTDKGLDEELVRRYGKRDGVHYRRSKRGGLSSKFHNYPSTMRSATVRNLDEYYPMPPNHPDSLSYRLCDRLVNHINLKPENVQLIDGSPRAPFEEVSYCRYLDVKKPSDLTVLGIGSEGHIAFNLPGSSFDSRTRIVSLSKEIRATNKVPHTRAITLGIGTTMDSKNILLLANGRHKADALHKAIKGEITKEVPASVLRKHRNPLFIIDEAAASKILEDYDPESELVSYYWKKEERDASTDKDITFVLGNYNTLGREIDIYLFQT